MKVVKVTTLYPAYTQQFYAARPGLAERSYGDQHDALARDGFGWADFWAHAMAPLGYELQEIWANVLPLQRAWAREAASDAADQDDWVHAVAMAQIAQVQPDVLFMDEYTTFPAAWVQEVRRRVPSIRFVLGWCGAPYQDGTVFRAYDVVLSNIPELVQEFRGAGHHAYHVNHAFDPRILERMSPATIDTPVSFVGQIQRGRGAHAARERLLTHVASALPLAVFAPGERPTVRNRARAAARTGAYHVVRAVGGVAGPRAAGRLPLLGRVAAWPGPPQGPLRGPLGRSLRAPVFGLEMFQTLRRSAVTLNIHIDISRDSASNMRMFEATGAGTCLLTDAKRNLAELFEPDVEVVTYRSPEECAERVRWLLDHPAERDRVARAGQARTLRDHTFANRAPVVDEIIRRSV